MEKLDLFVSYLIGEFDNSKQIHEEYLKGKIIHPYARHVNTIMNDQVKNLPPNFEAYIILEESYYTQKEKTNAQPHLFLFSLNENDDVMLTSYDLPTDIAKDKFTYDNEELDLDFNTLTLSRKFVPMVYEEIDGSFVGTSISMFTPIVKFVLHESMSQESLIVEESMYASDKKTFGFDGPIIYRRMSEEKNVRL